MRTIAIVAGLDPTGGAGILADARVAADFGVRASGVVTALTLQDTRGVRAVSTNGAPLVGEQLRLLLADVGIDAVKIGMLGDDRVALAVARALAATPAPIVWDPVLVSSSGAPLLQGDREAVVTALLGRVRVVTPNAPEAEALTGIAVTDEDGMRAAASALRLRGARAVVIKGGHLAGPDAIDVLHDGELVEILDSERLDVGPVHGTGCVLSAAIACGLALGRPLEEAVVEAKSYLLKKLGRPLAVGRGARCLV